MLTPQLEKLIREGKALYKTYAIGGSGVGTIPVQTNEKVVIVDFTWHPFCDVNPINPIGTFDYFPILTVDIKNIAPGVPPTFSPGDSISGLALIVPKGTGKVISFVSTGVDTGILEFYVITGDFSTVDNFINTTAAHTADVDSAFTVHPISPGDDIQDSIALGTGTVLTNTPVATLNFSPGTLTIDHINGTFSTTDPILNLTTLDISAIQDGVMTLDDNTEGIIEEALANSIHTIRFRSQGVENVFNFRDIPVALLPLQVSGGGTPELVPNALLGFSLPDPIQVHTYIQCPQTVQIDIWKFSPSGNVFTQGNPDPKSNEPDVPAGYTNAVANPPVVTITTGEGAIIKPLGTSRDETATGARLHNEFYDDIGDLTELNPPSTMQSFPLVNIGYVLINDARP